MVELWEDDDDEAGEPDDAASFERIRDGMREHLEGLRQLEDDMAAISFDQDMAEIDVLRDIHRTTAAMTAVYARIVRRLEQRAAAQE